MGLGARDFRLKQGDGGKNGASRRRRTILTRAEGGERGYSLTESPSRRRAGNKYPYTRVRGGPPGPHGPMVCFVWITAGGN
jgi:hypothetical protein